jgi:hypothetical protein
MIRHQTTGHLAEPFKLQEASADPADTSTFDG